MSSEIYTKFLIVGAGISGITFANFVKNDFIIIEKDKTAGGYCKTIKRNGFVWDYSGHFYHFNSDFFRDFFLSNMKNEKIIYSDKCTKILYNDCLIDYPFQSNIHQLEKSEFIDCLYDLFNRPEKKSYSNFLDMLYGKFGNSIVNKFLKPYNEKLYAVNLETLDKDAMGRFFPYANIDAIIKNMKVNNQVTYNSTFLYPANGAYSFIDSLLKNIDVNNMKFNCELTRVDDSNKIAYTSDNTIIHYEYLINTIPLNKFLGFFDRYSSLVNNMSYNKVLVLNMGFDGPSPKIKKEHWIYVPSKDINFYRIGFYNNILKDDKLSVYIEIGYNFNAIIDKKEIDKQIKLSIKNLISKGIITSSMKLVDYEPIVMDPAYVHINGKIDKKLDKVKDELERKNIYTIGRYGMWTYNSMEDCMSIAKNLALKLMEGNDES